LISSTHWATWGKRELTGIPLCPCCLNSHGELRTLPTLSNWVGWTLALMGWPCSFSRRGLGSKVSTWEGPPSMKRKVAFLARGVGCWVLGTGDFGFWILVLGLKASASSARRVVRARAPKPLAQVRSISRRDMGSFWKWLQCMG